MRRYVREVVQKPKISNKEIILHIIISILLVLSMALVLDSIYDPFIKVICKIIIVLAQGSCILHLIHRLILRIIWFDINDPEYQTEYIELHNDYIVIYERELFRKGHCYSYAKVYYDDIKHTQIRWNSRSKFFKMRISLKRDASIKTLICNCNGRKDLFITNSGTEDMYITTLKGYPTELVELLRDKYYKAMKVTVTC
ncbi:MAG: hypothetical protein GX288_01900 [Clostridiales bacterium]|nr:hypothetical protein [Clostridiales bacterium]